MSAGYIDGETMKAGRSISMEVATWMEVEKIASEKFGGEVSAAVEYLCRIALEVPTIEEED